MTIQDRRLIKVLVVDDSPTVRKVLTNILNADSQIIVVGAAGSGREAIALAISLKPDIITLDIDMPEMDGLEVTRQIMAYCPTPILIVSASVPKVGMGKMFEAISSGALDVFEKGELEFKTDPKFHREFVEKIKLLSGIRVISHPRAKIEKRRELQKLPPFSKIPSPSVIKEDIVAIAVSTGGPQILQEILRKLPKIFSCGIVIVQHIMEGFLEGMVVWLHEFCEIRLKVAEDGEEIKPGTAYFAPSGFQMRVDEFKKVRLTDEPSCGGFKPSASVLLESVGMTYEEKALGIILSGIGDDGVSGIKVIKQMGGTTFAQDEKSSVVFGMPKAAIEAGAIDSIFSTDQMANAILQWLRR